MILDDFGIILTSKIAGFGEFFAISGCGTHLKSEFSLQSLEIEQDNLRVKLNSCCRAFHER